MSNYKATDVIEQVSDWIKDSVIAAGCKGTVIGLSGGIDSAVVAALSQKAFPETTLGLILPCYSEPDDIEDAKLVAETLGIQALEINLNKIFDEMSSALTDLDKASDMAVANIKPRLRMTVLYYYAQVYEYLVLGTGNKSEDIIGYFTKYGDGAADLMPIASFSKMEVYQFAEILNIPDRIKQRPPTAGIIPGQTDEDELGFTYGDLEKYLAGEQVEQTVKEQIEQLKGKSDHKRKMPPKFTL